MNLSATLEGGLRITTGGSRIRRWETRPRGSVTDPKMRRHGGPRHDERPGPFRDDLGPAIALYATLRGLQPSPNRERLPPRTKRTKQKHEPRNVGLYHLTDAPNWLRFAYHLWPRWTRVAPHYSKISVVLECWKTRWLFGAANSDGLRQRKEKAVGIIILTAILFG